MRFLEESLELVRGRTVGLRIDADVPMDGEIVEDDSRLRAAEESISLLLEADPKRIVILAHLGRPRGCPNPGLSLRPVSEFLSKLVKRPISFLEGAVGTDIEEKLESVDSKIVFLENLRFSTGEEANGRAFVNCLYSALKGGVYVFDAFASSAKKHASTWGLIRRFPKKTRLAGPRMKKELDGVQEILSGTQSPLTLIFGGKKVADKIAVMEKLGQKADRVIVGGLMAMPFLVAKGLLPKRRCHGDELALAEKGMRALESAGTRLILPVDFVATERIECYPRTWVARVGDPIHPDVDLPDIGPETARAFTEAIISSAVIVANCTMGVFEVPGFESGTNALARALKISGAKCYIGGGDTILALKRANVLHHMHHVSMGGGALLKALEGKGLPAVKALDV